MRVKVKPIQPTPACPGIDAKRIIAFISYVLLCMQGQKYDAQSEYKVDYTYFKENNELLANIKHIWKLLLLW